MNRDEALDVLVRELEKWPIDLQNCISRAAGWEWTNSGHWIVLCGSGPMVEAIITENDWKGARAKADARMNNIVRNGNDGGHYEDQSVENSGGFEQNENYKQNDGGDLIDRWAIKYTRTEFRAVMRAQVEKYYDRYGDKDSFVSESRKAADYALRLHEYEVKWAAEDNEGW